MSDADGMDDLKRLLAENPPPKPGTTARVRAMAAAQATFEAEDVQMADAPARAEDEKITANSQGTADETRQSVRQTGLMTLIRRRLMNLSIPSTRQMMMGGASVAVLAIAVFAVQHQDLRMDPLGGDHAGAPANVTPEPARVTDSKDEAGATDLTSTAPATPEAPRQPASETPAGDLLGRLDKGSNAPAKSDAPKPVTTGDDARLATPADRERAATGAPAADGTVAGLRDSAENLAPPAPMVEETEADAAPRPGIVFHGGSGGGVANRRLELKPAQGRVAEQRKRADSFRAAPSKPEPVPADTYSETGRDRFPDAEPNQVKLVSEEPVSTFSVDVDTASYAFMRQALNRGILPAKDSIRIEELINYFPYDYRAPQNRQTPFAADVTVMDTPWNDGTRLMRIGIKGYQIQAAEKPVSNLVLLIDTSGSMNAPEKLPLLIRSFEMLLETLGENDTVSIVAYAGSAGTVLEPTKASEMAKIRAALNRLSAGGSTAGGEGVRLAYDLAQANFNPDGVNRVILATDGDFNVGIRNTDELKGFVERKRDTGVFLSVLGFGRGNYNDALMQALAQNGNGQAAYIDTIGEARKVLVDEASSTLFPIAKDVKIQVDFNPNVVAEYRLIGYETRKLNREDFNNDKIDAAEIGSGHTVTALYEITPVGSDARLVDPSRYETPAVDAGDRADEYAFVKIRYKDPNADTSKLITRPVTNADETTPDADARFAAAVAAFGQLLRGGRHTGDFSFDDVIELANGAKGTDAYNYRGEFVQLVRKAKHARAMERQ